MRIGILVSSISNFGEKGFYNSQEVGLGKALSQLCDEVVIYKFIGLEGKRKSENITGYSNVKMIIEPTTNLGINGKVKTEILDKTLDAIVYFSDTQLSVSRVYSWAKDNNVMFIPYIGSIQSRSKNLITKSLINFMAKKNIRIYKKCSCLAKTPEVKKELQRRGIKRITIAPVGLDTSLLNEDYLEYDKENLKVKFGYSSDDKVLLFVGRMTDEKKPLEILEIYTEVLKSDSGYKLLMVGTGELLQQVKNKIADMELEKKVCLIERIPNNEIWQLYCIADSFVNLNDHEIFGMAILEAMYYDCRVIAWRAPGPNFIIKDGKTGWLVSSKEEIIQHILENRSVNSHQAILDSFTWDICAKTIIDVIGEIAD